MKGQLRCVIRHKWVEDSPEERVRQSILDYLMSYRHYPKGRFSVESMVKVNGQSKRSDIIVHGEHGQALMVVECKAPYITIDERTLTQIAMYNHTLDAPYLLLSNGQHHHMFHLDKSRKEMVALDAIPEYNELRTHA
jgi:type I site-specific restriction endonuclease